MFAAPSFSPPVVSHVGNTGSALVGAIRWDAWFHSTADTIRTAIEASLGPSQYHWRLPFFATETGTDSVTISGQQSDMDTEITYAAESGLDFWAFFWYGLDSTNGMKTAWDYFQASPNKANINWCLYFSGVAPLHNDITNNLASIIGYLQQSNYQKTSGGRPLVFVFDDSSSKANLAADISALRAAAISAGLSDPYIAFHQSSPSASVITTYGFDATTTYAPVTSASGPKSYKFLDYESRATWRRQAAQGVDVIPCFTMGWDRRPRVENPVPWETPTGSVDDYYYHERMSDIGTHVDACLAWVRDNPALAPANVIIGYAWNENDEGGWISPTLAMSGVNRGRLDALKDVLTLIDPDVQTGAYLSQGII